MYDNQSNPIKNVEIIHPEWKDKKIDWITCQKIFFNDHPNAQKMDVPYPNLPIGLQEDDYRVVFARTDPTVVRWKNYFDNKYSASTSSAFFLLFIDALIRPSKPS